MRGPPFFMLQRTEIMSDKREGSLDAPTRHPLAWRDEAFYDEAALDAETRRVFDICHGCRRCFNLCDSFPRLFDLVDASKTGELDSVSSAEFGPVVDACTLCDMCFMTKCPYVPPHEFNLDFPHLMLRHRAVQAKQGRVSFADRQLAKTDRNARLAGRVARLANWAAATGNRLTRPLMERLAGIDRAAPLPLFKSASMAARWSVEAVPTEVGSATRKAVIYATCHINGSDPDLGFLAQKLLAANGIETDFVYPECCGMPQLEQGALEEVAAKAARVAAAMRPWIDRGHDIVALVPSCALMLKLEWPLIVPDNDDVRALAAATRDVTELIVDIAKREGLARAPQRLDAKVALHIACHARAQNMGRKAEELLRLVPGLDIEIIERCSGHGGAWGVKKGNFAVATKIGRPAVRAAAKTAPDYLVSECPLAAQHLQHGLDTADDTADDKAGGTAATHDPGTTHPLQIFALSCGIGA